MTENAHGYDGTECANCGWGDYPDHFEWTEVFSGYFGEGPVPLCPFCFNSTPDEISGGTEARIVDQIVAYVVRHSNRQHNLMLRLLRNDPMAFGPDRESVVLEGSAALEGLADYLREHATKNARQAEEKP